MAVPAGTLVLALFVLATVAPLAFATDRQPKSCTDSKCKNPIWAVISCPDTPSGQSLAAACGTSHLHIGLGVKNHMLDGKTTGYFNLEWFSPPPIGNIVAKTKVSDPYHCCRACAAQTGCKSFLYYPTSPYTFSSEYPVDKNGNFIDPSHNSNAIIYTYVPFTLTTEQASYPSGYGSNNCFLMDKKYKPSKYYDPPGKHQNPGSQIIVAGGNCNPAAWACDDPHLVGALGTKFDFNGGLKESYCLVSDKNFHINTFLDGYDASVTASNSTEKTLRTWIKEVGIVWNAAGKLHTAHFKARKGKQQERGSGFLTDIVVDGKAMPVPKVGGNISAAGGLKVAFMALEKKHIFDVDYYTIEIEGILRLDTRMRVAHPALQSNDDAEAHFNLALAYINNSPDIHGVLGQTYRKSEERVQRAVKYQTVAETLKGKPMEADGKSGAGFLDGHTKDYVSSSILSPDCKFSTFDFSSAKAAETL